MHCKILTFGVHFNLNVFFVRVRRWSVSVPSFVVENDEKYAIFTIEGPAFPVQCICYSKEVEFPVSESLLLLYET